MYVLYLIITFTLVTRWFFVFLVCGCDIDLFTLIWYCSELFTFDLYKHNTQVTRQEECWKYENETTEWGFFVISCEKEDRESDIFIYYTYMYI